MRGIRSDRAGAGGLSRAALAHARPRQVPPALDSKLAGCAMNAPHTHGAKSDLDAHSHMMPQLRMLVCALTAAALWAPCAAQPLFGAAQNVDNGVIASANAPDLANSPSANLPPIVVNAPSVNVPTGVNAPISANNAPQGVVNIPPSLSNTPPAGLTNPQRPGPPISIPPGLANAPFMTNGASPAVVEQILLGNPAFRPSTPQELQNDLGLLMDSATYQFGSSAPQPTGPTITSASTSGTTTTVDPAIAGTPVSLTPEQIQYSVPYYSFCATRVCLCLCVVYAANPACVSPCCVRTRSHCLYAACM